MINIGKPYRKLPYRVYLLSLSAGIGLAVLSGCASFFSTAAKPNILLILVDDLGLGDLTCYGAPDMHTPNIDELAAKGMLFTNFYAASPVCSPTRAALLSGRNPYEIGVPGVIRANKADSWGYLSTQVTLLPEWLGQQGYYTGLVGKWHLGLELPNLPNERGFEYFAGFLSDKMDDYYTHLREGKQYLRINNAPVEPKGHATEIFTRWACDFIAKSAEQQRPFFLYLAYNAPHNPIQPPPEWISNYKKQFPQADEKRALYGAFVAHLDQQIGLVLQALQKAGAEQNTLVVFTSDNGAALPHGGSNNSYHSGKPTLYEGGLRVPAVVRFPGVVKPAQQSDVFALTTDIMPTICQMLDQPAPNCPPTDGIGFWHILTNQTTNNQSIKPTSRQIFWTVRDADGIFGKGSTLEALRKGNLKIMRTLPDSLPELYDLAADPLETINLAATHAQVYRHLLTELDSIKNRVNAIPYQSPAVWGR